MVATIVSYAAPYTEQVGSFYNERVLRSNKGI